MAEVNVLIIVDVEGASTSKDLGANVWMLDTGKYNGTQECGNELVTKLNAGDELRWTLTPIDPGSAVTFASGQPFSGQALPNIIDPKPDPVNPSSYLSRFFPPAGTPSGTDYQYTVSLNLEGNVMSFDPSLYLNNPTLKTTHRRRPEAVGARR